jgi:hypothetical protein
MDFQISEIELTIDELDAVSAGSLRGVIERIHRIEASKGTLYNRGDDTPLNWLGLFNAN